MLHNEREPDIVQIVDQTIMPRDFLRVYSISSTDVWPLILEAGL
jgi:hypothetical protein